MTHDLVNTSPASPAYVAGLLRIMANLLDSAAPAVDSLTVALAGPDDHDDFDGRDDHDATPAAEPIAAKPRRKGRDMAGERNPAAKLSADQASAIREAGRYNVPCRLLARLARVSPGAVKHVQAGRRWTHLA